ncbi:flagellar hook basal-body protein [Alphaproteobacteria bacterium]|nr:flagellar hook basal-body protein [Alphaproteobacteria bacterium]
MISVIRSGIDVALNDLNVTSNNIANAKTTGFKKRQATFADVYGQTDAIKTSGARIGMGALTAENRLMSEQGSLQQTGDVLDLAIEGQGMFTLVDVTRPDEKLYTRDGSFTVNSDGLIANADGMQLMSALGAAITVPMTASTATTVNGAQTFAEAPLTGVAVRSDGRVEATYGKNNTFFVGQIGLANFADPNRLAPIGQNYFKENTRSGAGALGAPIEAGRGKVHSGALEMSNIDMTSELSNLMRAQQAFSGSSRLLQSETEMARKFTQ